MVKTKVKKGDQVLVIAGKDKDQQAKVLRVFPSKGTAIVERVNMVKKHTRPNPQKQIQGGILEKEMPIRLSNLKVVCPECGKPARMGRKRLKVEAEGTTRTTPVRVCKNCNATVN
jgi:large subunit ribosomal protein L24